MNDGSKTAVVLFSMGGPDCPDAIEPFLVNLFSDPAILRVPRPIRAILARVIARCRAGKAAAIYNQLGGRSPLLANTIAQAEALENALAEFGNFRTFVVMRYWKPFSDTVVSAVRDYCPDHVILLPMYPQWSTTTTASSFSDWKRACEAIGADFITQAVCCYYQNDGFISTIAASIRGQWDELTQFGVPRLLFSAHGLPSSIVAAGDPYQWQCEGTARAIVSKLSISDLDWRNCYQSRVGPMKWIGPATPAEIVQAGTEKRPIMLVPIAFVSEHSETLVELDQEYRDLAIKAGVPAFVRIPTVGVAEPFIKGLAQLVLSAGACGKHQYGDTKEERCPGHLPGCFFHNTAKVSA